MIMQVRLGYIYGLGRGLIFAGIGVRLGWVEVRLV